MQLLTPNNLAPSTPRQWTITNPNSGVSINMGQVNPGVFNVIVAKPTATVNLSGNHQLMFNDLVTLNATGAAVSSLSGTYNITNLSASGFDINIRTVDTINDGTYGVSGLFGPCFLSLSFSKAKIFGRPHPRSGNLYDSYIGVQPTLFSQPMRVPPSGEYELIANPGAKFNLDDYYLQVGTGNDGAIVTLWP